jgi:hypothetical protein
MLLPILFIVAAIAIAAGAVLQESLLAAKTAMHERATRYAETGVARAVSDYVVTFYPQGACAPAGACPFTLTTVARFSASSSQPSGGPGGNPDTATAEQRLWLREHRVSAAIEAVVTGPGGDVQATRARFITMRVYGTAPYATVIGVRDFASPAGASTAAQGDSGGTPPTQQSNGKEPNPRIPDGYSDTRIQVHLVCRRWQSGSGIHNWTPGNEGLPWGVQNATGAFEIECTQKDADISTFGDERWSNGDENSGAWTR